MPADGFERGKSNRPGLAGFEHGKILRRDPNGLGQVIEAHFARREHDVQIDNDGHELKRSNPVPLEFSGLRP